MIRGGRLGAGVNIALCCDLRIAADDARPGVPAAKVGLGYRASSMKNLVATIAANAPLTMSAAKLITRELLKSPSNFNEAACKAAVARCFESEDYREGRRAFMEKRKPAFRGR